MTSVDDSREVAGAAAPLDLLLTQAAQGTVRRLSPGKPGLRFLGGLARRPDKVAARARSLAGQLAQGLLNVGVPDEGSARSDRVGQMRKVLAKVAGLE